MKEGFRAVFYDDSNTWGTPHRSFATRELAVKWLETERSDHQFCVINKEEYWVKTYEDEEQVIDDEYDLDENSEYYVIRPDYWIEDESEFELVARLEQCDECAKPGLKSRLLAGEFFVDGEFHGLLHQWNQPPHVEAGLGASKNETGTIDPAYVADFAAGLASLKPFESSELITTDEVTDQEMADAVAKLELDEDTQAREVERTFGINIYRETIE